MPCWKVADGRRGKLRMIESKIVQIDALSWKNYRSRELFRYKFGRKKKDEKYRGCYI